MATTVSYLFTEMVTLLTNQNLQFRLLVAMEAEEEVPATVLSGSKAPDPHPAPTATSDSGHSVSANATASIRSNRTNHRIQPPPNQLQSHRSGVLAKMPFPLHLSQQAPEDP